jgi:isopentenyl diphosphate isomerase/L-lactate dehydrogenase-like FMN-dependent dehydrogenase
MIGRPWVWALAGAGPVGLAAYLSGLQRELRLAMMLTGCRSIAEIDLDRIDRTAHEHFLDTAR